MLRMYLAMLVLILPAADIPADESPSVTASSTIDAVTVFADRAMVKRVFSGDFRDGKMTVKIPDLPAGLLNESVRVSGKGTPGAKISGVWVETEYFEETLSGQIKSLKSELEVFKKREKELLDRSEVLSKKQKFIDNISAKSLEPVPTAVAAQKPTAAEWAEMVNFIESELDKINAEKRSIDEEKRSIAEKKEIVTKQLNKFSADISNSSKTVMVELHMESPGYFDFNLSYIVRGATWKPVYDIRAESDADTIDMLMFAEIRQNTGENWDNVSMELSTARPSLSARPPDPRPWIIGLHDVGRFGARGGRGEINKYVTSSELKTKQMSLMVEGDELQTATGLVSQNMDTQWAISDVTEQMISTSFVLAQRENIPGNNTPKKVSVKAVNMAGDTEYFASPRQSPFAYLKTELTNKTNFPFLEGVASVFLDGNFVHSTIIPMVVPEEKFDLYLGIDDKIKINRELVEKFTDESGMLSRKDKLSYSFKITVENFKQAAHKITVLDQYPVSQNDQIDVKLTKVSPETEPDELDISRGFLRWIFDLEPDHKKEISFAYEIKYPDDYKIPGLQ
ncbi:MAG: mucoidy inhibitor MuiA family protein [Candidatus Zixiibacteriota bacterium]|nr:MAG: mucoidy inhibitor MuiA family protein [candidate division Zixibacteria bacterium]